jgi:hypothetical protein
MKYYGLDINSNFIIKVERVLKKLLSFSFLQFQTCRHIYLFHANKRFSAEKLIKKYKRVSRNVSYKELLNLVSNVHIRYPDDITTADKLAGLLQAGNRHEEACHLVKKICIKRKQMVATDLDDDYESKVSGLLIGPVIQISGYFYSGSGAVLDYLKGYKDSIKWAPDCEVRIIKFPGGLGDLFAKLKSSKRISIIEIVDLYLHITGSFYVKTGVNHYNKNLCVNRDSRRVLNSPQAASYIYELLSLWESLLDFSEKNFQTEKEFLNIVRHGLHRAFNSILYCNNAKIVLIDQMVTAWRLPLAVLLPPSRFIIVYRDPRDQFVDANNVMGVPGRHKWTKEEFIKIYKNRRASVQEWIPKLEKSSNHAFLQISFEDFVMDTAAQKSIIDNFLGLDRNSYSEELSEFDPDVSSVNVGKYKKHLKKEVQNFFKENVPEFCRD